MTDETPNPHVWAGKGTPIYGSLLGDTDEQTIDRLLDFKKRLGLKREDHITKQKEFAKEKQFELAKYHSACAKDIMRMLHAMQNFLAYLLANPPGDCAFKPMKDWGRDLVDECHSVDAFLSYNIDSYIVSLLED